MISSISDIFASLASLGCLYLFVVLAITLLRKRKGVAHPVPEAVTILKPLYGESPRLAECLASFCVQDYAAPVQIVFGLHDRTDPALAIVQSLKERFANLDIAIVVDETSHGTNGKISNLINMSGAAKHGILIASDGDIAVPPDYAAQIVAQLQKPKVGGVSVLYYGDWEGSVWSRLQAAWIDTHFLPSVMVGRALGLAEPCFGSTIALRREVLERIGGFEAFADQLADDYAIGAAVREAGYTLEIGPAAVGHVCHVESFGAFFRHQLRWARTIRSIDLPGYLGSLVSHPLPFALAGAALGSGTCLGLAVLAMSLRIGLSKVVARSFEAPGQPVWLLPVTDLLSFGVFVWSFCGSHVTWKRASFTVLGDGTLVHSR